MGVEVALQWCADGYSDNLVGFVNSVKTLDGGTHLDGLKAALTRMLNAVGRKARPPGVQVSWSLTVKDLCARLRVGSACGIAASMTAHHQRLWRAQAHLASSRSGLQAYLIRVTYALLFNGACVLQTKITR